MSCGCVGWLVNELLASRAMQLNREVFDFGGYARIRCVYASPLATLGYFLAVAIATSILFGQSGCSKEPVVDDLPDDALAVADQIVVENTAKPEQEAQPVSEYTPSEIAAASASYRLIQVKTKNGRHVGRFSLGRQPLQYRRFESGVIRSQNALDSFIETEVASTPLSFKAIPHFLTTLMQEKIDFSKEVLILLRHTEQSISIQVRLKWSALSASSESNLLRNLAFRIHRKITPDSRAIPAEDVEYCFPVVVDTSLVDTVSLEENGQENYSVNLSKAPSIKVAPRVREKWEPAPPKKTDSSNAKRAARANRNAERKKYSKCPNSKDPLCGL